MSFADQFQDFKFAIAQPFDRIRLAFSLAMREFCNYLLKTSWIAWTTFAMASCFIT
jgi:hypothetical protein